MIKILHLSKFYPPFQGGIETFLYDLNEDIYDNYREGIQSDVVSFNSSNISVDDINNGYLVHRSAMYTSISKMPISFNYISWLFKNASKYDIIHLHYPNPFADLALLLSCYNGKLIVHWHSDIIKQKITDIIYSPLRFWMLNKAKKIIATSPSYSIGSKYLRKYSKKVVVIPLGFNRKRLPYSKPSKIKKIKDKYLGKKIIFSLGRQVYYKGFEYLIKSAIHLDSSFIILIGGKGELFDYHKKLIENLNLSDKVKMVGFVTEEDVSSYYQACEVFAMSSIKKSEAFGVVQLEAMSFGKPIISTDIKGSGVGWVNQNGYSGIVVPTMNELAIANAIISITKNKKIDFGNQSKDRYNENFKINVITKKIINIYLNL